MHRQRLAITGDHERLARARFQIFRALGNPFRINPGRLRDVADIHAQFRRNGRRDLNHHACWQTQAMIRADAGKREERFHRVQAAHRIFGLLNFPPLGKATDVVVRVFLAADEIAVERENRLRLVVAEDRLDRLAERLGGRALMHVGINRVIQKPLRLRELLGNLLVQPPPRR